MSQEPKTKELTIEDVLVDDRFKKLVRKKLHDLISKRNSRPEPKKGYRYKRDWYDRMSGNGQLSTDFFLENIGSIWLKTSNLNSAARSVILSVCNQAFNEYFKSTTKSQTLATK